MAVSRIILELVLNEVQRVRFGGSSWGQGRAQEPAILVSIPDSLGL